MKIIFLINATEQDKSRFIAENYKDREKCKILDTSDLLNYKSIDFSDDDLDQKYIVELGVQTLIEGCDLVVEYVKQKHETDLNILIHSAENIGLKTEVFDFQNGFKNAQRISGIDHLDKNRIIRTIISTYAESIGIEEICVVGGKNVLIKFYKHKNKGNEIFFYATNQKCIFNYNHDEEIGQNSGEREVEEFESFQEAFENIQRKYHIFQLYPLRINEKYTSAFNKAYQKFLGYQKTDFNFTEWNEFLN